MKGIADLRKKKSAILLCRIGFSYKGNQDSREVGMGDPSLAGQAPIQAKVDPKLASLRRKVLLWGKVKQGEKCVPYHTI